MCMSPESDKSAIPTNAEADIVNLESRRREIQHFSAFMVKELVVVGGRREPVLPEEVRQAHATHLYTYTKASQYMTERVIRGVDTAEQTHSAVKPLDVRPVRLVEKRQVERNINDFYRDFPLTDADEAHKEKSKAFIEMHAKTAKRNNLVHAFPELYYIGRLVFDLKLLYPENKAAIRGAEVVQAAYGQRFAHIVTGKDRYGTSHRRREVSGYSAPSPDNPIY